MSISIDDFTKAHYPGKAEMNAWALIHFVRGYCDDQEKATTILNYLVKEANIQSIADFYATNDIVSIVSPLGEECVNIVKSLRDILQKVIKEES